MAVSMEDVKTLRAMTGAGMMDVKKTLEEADGDVDRAAELLRERGVAKAAKKTDREVTEGFVGHYVHHNGKIGVIVELNCETDFVGRNEEFRGLARELAIHIAMAAPEHVSRDQVPQEDADAERERLKKEALQEGKPEHIVDKMVEGRMDKFFAQTCLLEQPYVKDDSKTVDELLKESIATIGENIQVGSFHRIAIGE